VAWLWTLVIAGGIGMGAASWYLIEVPFQRVLGSRRPAATATAAAGRPGEIDATVQA
jgi:peptidoglycan/LPS O-acetylase OafA/YrhL